MERGKRPRKIQRNVKKGSAVTYTDFIRACPEAWGSLEKGIGEEIVGIEALKKGRTNCSFLVTGKENKYVFRMPGAGADELVDRRGEAKAYAALRGTGIADEVLYLDPASGHKIARYYENARACDGFFEADVRRLTAKLKELHARGLKTDTVYDFFYYIDYYERLRKGEKSVFPDYEAHKKRVFSLKAFLDAHAGAYCLIHNDMSPDNCLFVPEGDGEAVRFIDWEYAAMQDPCADVAYFCTCCDYSPEQIDKIIAMYDTESSDTVKAKIYCFIAVNALVQSNWSEFKRTVGKEEKEENERIYDLSKRYYEKSAERIEQELL